MLREVSMIEQKEQTWKLKCIELDIFFAFMFSDLSINLSMKPILFPISFGEYFGGDLVSFKVMNFG